MSCNYKKVKCIRLKRQLWAVHDTRKNVQGRWEDFKAKPEKVSISDVEVTLKSFFEDKASLGVSIFQEIEHYFR